MDAVQLALEGIDDIKRISANNPMLTIVESADEMEVAHIHGLVGVLIGLEGGHTLGASLAVLRSMYSLGTRFISLTGLECTTPWAAAVNNIDLVYDETQPISLTTFGEVITV